ncbi:hypothetical protein ABK040_009317 [Willaertia magna]
MINNETSEKTLPLSTPSFIKMKEYDKGEELAPIFQLSQKVKDLIDEKLVDTSRVKKCLDNLKKGVNLEAVAKTKDKVAKPKLHIFVVDNQESYIRIEKKKEKKANVLLKDITKVVSGQAFTKQGSLSKYFEKSKKHAEKYDPDLCATVHYGNSGGHFDVIFTNVDDCIDFLIVLNYLIKSNNLTTINPMQVMLMRYWILADENCDNKLSIQEIGKLMNKLNIEVNTQYLKQFFNTYDVDKSGSIDFKEFQQMFRNLQPAHPDVEKLFVTYTKLPNVISVNDFSKLLKEYQLELKLTDDDCINLFKKHGSISVDNVEMLPLFEFQSYIFSGDNSILPKEYYELNHDMNLPLTHYYIGSSHNTYLAGHQLKGLSSVEMYTRALQTGYKCLELDCWDGDNGQVIIFHGRTLTTKILFEDVIKAINEYGFKTSPYPVILSLDVHCSISGQEKMAEIMKEIFGDKLLYPNETMKEWPSPNDLKYKVILKNKRLPSSGTNNNQLVTEDDDEDEEVEELLENESLVVPSSNVEITNQNNDNGTVVKPPKTKVKIAQKLSDIIALATGKLESFNFESPCWKMHSLSEDKIMKYCQTDYFNLAKFTINHFIRSYPRGTRFDSSNFDPFYSFLSGCQMPSLNIQTYDCHLRMNELLFMENGRSGYLLKPDILRNRINDLSNTNVKLKLSLKILMGRQIPRPHNAEKGEIVDPFVKITVHGVPLDRKTVVTETVWNNGFNPVWNSTITFELTCPDLALLQVSIYDKNVVKSDEFVCENYIPVKWIRSGIRSILMYDEKLQIIEGCCLLVDVDKKF